jgi:hypothetical protein
VNVTDAPAQIDVWLATTDTAGVTLVDAVIVIGVLAAVGVVRQLALLVMVTVMISPLASVLLVNTLLFVPAFTPFTCHW